MITLYPDPLLRQGDSLVSGGGQATTAFFFLLQTLHQRTGGNSGIPFTVGNALEAAGLTQATALALSNDFNEVLLGGGLGVQLAALQPGQTMVVFNGSGAGIRVYPSVSGQIDAIAMDDYYSLANGKTQIFTCYSLLASGGSFYRSLQLG